MLGPAQDAIRYGSYARKGNELEALYVSSTWAISAIRRELSGLALRPTSRNELSRKDSHQSIFPDPTFPVTSGKG